MNRNIKNLNRSKKRFTLHASLFSFLFVLGAYGQVDDPRSQKIIDDMVARFKTYPGVSVSFSATVTQLQDQSETELEGKIWIKNNYMYKLEIPDQMIFFDGSKIYQYMPGFREVNVTKPDPDENDEDFQLLNPLTYFNISSGSFKTNFVKESTQNNRKVDEIDLYPVHVKTTRYSRIRVMVGKSDCQLAYLKAFMKDGTHYAVTFMPYEIHKTALPDSFFTFSKREHPDVEVIDLTF